MAALQYKDDHNKIAYLGGGNRLRGLHRYPQLFGPLSIKVRFDTWPHPVVLDVLVKHLGTSFSPNAAGSHNLVATIDSCGPKSGSWNQFPSSIATSPYLFCRLDSDTISHSLYYRVADWEMLRTTKNRFLMYPRFLQMIVAIETADRTPRPTFGFTRKLFANMKFKWEGQPMPLTPLMLAIAAAGDAAVEENAAAHEADGSTAEAHPEPHSPPVSPVRELTPEGS
ncbi:hypothetical protein Tco_1030038 [Tanacetum coccineum]|uniref:Uncharacterized protein n=1 Tax=Tanacetum coccineum TaxID=301880 RepID=A0ABQ5G6X8_9ASTR